MFQSERKHVGARGASSRRFRPLRRSMPLDFPHRSAAFIRRPRHHTHRSEVPTAAIAALSSWCCHGRSLLRVSDSSVASSELIAATNCSRMSRIQDGIRRCSHSPLSQNGYGLKLIINVIISQDDMRRSPSLSLLKASSCDQCLDIAAGRAKQGQRTAAPPCASRAVRIFTTTPSFSSRPRNSASAAAGAG